MVYRFAFFIIFCMSLSNNACLTLSETDEITKDDWDSAECICNFIKYKKIPFNTFTINLKIIPSELNNIILGNVKDIHVKDIYETKLLNKDITLGEFKVDITEVIFLNFKEIMDIYNIGKAPLSMAKKKTILILN